MTVTAQKMDTNGMNRDGKIFYLDGTSEEGKLTYDSNSLKIKYADKSKKDIDVKSIDRFEVYKKNETLHYTYVLTERNYKKKKQPEFLCAIKFNTDKVQVTYELTTAARVGAFSFGKAVYFIQKKDDPYAIPLVKPGTNMHKRLKHIFSDCPELSAKIGDSYKWKKIDSLEPIIEEYNQNCPTAMSK